VFTRNASGVWSQQVYIKGSNNEANTYFTYRGLALDGDTLAIGGPGDGSGATGINGDQADNTVGGSGGVYLFTRNASGAWTQQAYIKASNPGESDNFAVVALDGDTLVVASPYEDSNATGVGGDQADNSARSSSSVYVFD